jgi:hypothetical protein
LRRRALRGEIWRGARWCCGRVLGDAESSLGAAKSSLGDAESSLGAAKSSLGDAESSRGDAESSRGDAKSSLGDAESSLGDAKSSLGDAKSSLAAACRRPTVCFRATDLALGGLGWCNRHIHAQMSSTTQFPLAFWHSLPGLTELYVLHVPLAPARYESNAKHCELPCGKAIYPPIYPHKGVVTPYMIEMEFYIRYTGVTLPAGLLEVNCHARPFH